MRRQAHAGPIFLGLLAWLVLALPASSQAATINPDVFFDGSLDTGNCTLREAVQASNLNEQVDACEAGDGAKRDTIALDAGEYNLTVDGDAEDVSETGDLDVTPEIGSGPLRIRGEGMGVTTIDAEHDDRVIDVAVLNDFGSLTLSNLTALGNSDRVLAGGVVDATESELVLDHVEVADGEAQFGGGVSCSSCFKVRILDSFIHDNQATTTSTGAPAVHARGGGISVSRDLVIENTSVTDNEAVVNDSTAIGGGIYAIGEVSIRSSFIGMNQTRSSSNSAISTRIGGGAYLGSLQEQSDAEVVNTTFSGNSASANGAESHGGGLAVAEETVADVFGTTLVDNVSSDGDELYARNGAEMNVSGSILASIGNGFTCAVDDGAIKSKGYNVLDREPLPADACMNGPKSSKDEIAEPVVSFMPINNGGATSTYVISSSSPALDLVPKKSCRPARNSDQRGVERPAGQGCDAGSYERTECADSLIDGQSIVGTPGKDRLTGTTGEDVFAPTAGADKLEAGDGDDLVCGGSGNDKLKGGDGSDQLAGNKGNDDCDGGPGNDSGKSCEKETSL